MNSAEKQEGETKLYRREQGAGFTRVRMERQRESATRVTSTKSIIHARKSHEVGEDGWNDATQPTILITALSLSAFTKITSRGNFKLYVILNDKLLNFVIFLWMVFQSWNAYIAGVGSCNVCLLNEMPVFFESGCKIVAFAAARPPPPGPKGILTHKMKRKSFSYV
jgi:hypothetical protein